MNFGNYNVLCTLEALQGFIGKVVEIHSNKGVHTFREGFKNIIQSIEIRVLTRSMRTNLFKTLPYQEVCGRVDIFKLCLSFILGSYNSPGKAKAILALKKII